MRFIHAHAHKTKIAKTISETTDNFCFSIFIRNFRSRRYISKKLHSGQMFARISCMFGAKLISIDLLTRSQLITKFHDELIFNLFSIYSNTHWMGFYRYLWKSVCTDMNMKVILISKILKNSHGLISSALWTILSQQITPNVHFLSTHIHRNR